MAADDHANALKLFDAVVKLDPKFAEGWNKRATLHYLMGNYRRSFADITKTLELEPRHFGALQGYAAMASELGDKKGALNAYQRAQSLNPHLDGVAEAIRRLTEQVRGRRI